MTNKILKEEMLSAEQLGLVAGGTAAENRVDVAFFHRLGYDMTRTSINTAYIENGVSYFGDGYYTNRYHLKMNGEWCKHPHFAALGYVLAQRKYPGFNGNWTDANYVKSFLADKFNIHSLG
ncbi:MAG: hypothetical protein IKO05_01300 [Selenomonadaceae bacterium]|nr:hypothetical protein [Selenomonadaceae bacterium]